MKKVPLAAILLLALALVASAGFASPAPAAAGDQATAEPSRLQVSASLAGTWNGVYTSSVVQPTEVTLIFQQLGSTVTGTYLSANGAQGVMYGTMQAGGTAQLTAQQTTPTCLGEFEMPVQVSGNTMTWSFHGEDCLGAENGSGKAERQ